MPKKQIVKDYYLALFTKHKAQLDAEFLKQADIGIDAYLKSKGKTGTSKSRRYYVRLKDGRLVHMKPSVRALLSPKPRHNTNPQNMALALDELMYAVEDTGPSKKNNNAEPEGGFIVPIRDGKDRTVKDRQNQRAFKAKLLRGFHNACWVTGCDIGGILDAAHITPYSECLEEPWRDSLSNGIILRADIHRLFENSLLGFKPTNVLGVYKVVIAAAAQNTDYREYHGKEVIHPETDYAEDVKRRLAL